MDMELRLPRSRWLAPLVILGSCIFLAMAGSGVLSAQSNGVSQLVIEVAGIESNDGAVIVSVFDSESDWLKDAVYSEILTISGKRASGVFANVPYGEYAVSVFHDENSNSELDSDLMRIPTEPYGFSNNAKASFGPATWQDSKFLIESESVLVSIVLEG